MIHGEIFVGEAGAGGVGEGAQGFYQFFTFRVDEEAAGARGVEEGGVDARDFVADFPGGAGAGYFEARLF